MVLPASMEADRLNRFTAAAAALQDAQVAARREAAEALIGVADEWLADTSVPRKQRLRQAQTTINALCMYIRSPFRLAKRLSAPHARYSAAFMVCAEEAPLAGLSGGFPS